MGPTRRTVQEYQTFLGHIRNKEIDLTTTIEENIVQSCKQDKQLIQRQLNRDIVGLNMYLNAARLNPQRKPDPKIETTILEALQKNGIVENEAWSVLSAFTQTIGMDLTASLQPLFNNERLDYIIRPNSEELKTDETAGLYLTTENKKASIKLVLLFKVIDSNDNEIAKIRTSIEIPDHSKAGAIVTTSVDRL